MLVTRARGAALGAPLGEQGWLQTANFVVAGLLGLAFAWGLRRALRPGAGALWTPLLVGAYGIGLVGAGVFITDPVSGYPPGTPERLTEYSTFGALHDIFSAPVFLGLPIAMVVMARAFHRWGRTAWTW